MSKTIRTDSQCSNRWGGWYLGPPPGSTAWWERLEHCWHSCRLHPWHLETPACWHLSTAEAAHNRKPKVCMCVCGRCMCVCMWLCADSQSSPCLRNFPFDDPLLIIPSLSLRFHFSKSTCLCTSLSTQSHLTLSFYSSFASFLIRLFNISSF